MKQPEPVQMSWLATDPPRPCPDVLTPEDAGVYLRIPAHRVLASLRRYRFSGRLRGVKVGNRCVYRRKDLEAFLDRQQELPG